MTGVKARGVGKSRWSRMAAVLQEEKMGKKKRWRWIEEMANERQGGSV